MAYPDVRPVVTFRFAHECGNVLSQTYYFSDATFTIQQGNAELHGTIETVDLGGIQFIHKTLTCARCGKSVVFPDREVK